MAEIFTHTDSEGDRVEIDHYPEAELHPYTITVLPAAGGLHIVGLSYTGLRTLRDTLTEALGESVDAESNSEEKKDKPKAVFSGKEMSVPDEGLRYMTDADVNNRIGVAFSILAGRAHISVGRGSSDIENGVYALIRDLAEEVVTGMRNLNEEEN